MSSFDTGQHPRKSDGKFAPGTTGRTSADVLDDTGEVPPQDALDAHTRNALHNVATAGKVTIHALRARDSYIADRYRAGGTQKEAEDHWNRRITAESKAGNISAGNAHRLRGYQPGIE